VKLLIKNSSGNPRSLAHDRARPCRPLVQNTGLWAVDGVRPTGWDLAGAAVALAGMGIIMFQPR
jgi:hypothetical protein